MWMGCAERFPFVHTSHPPLTLTHDRTNVRTWVCGSGSNPAGASRSPLPRRIADVATDQDGRAAAQRSGDSPISGNTAIQQYSFRAVHLTCIRDACTHLGERLSAHQRDRDGLHWAHQECRTRYEALVVLQSPPGPRPWYGMSVLVLANPVRDELLEDGVHRGAGRRGRELEPEM